MGLQKYFLWLLIWKNVFLLLSLFTVIHSMLKILISPTIPYFQRNIFKNYNHHLQFQLICIFPKKKYDYIWSQVTFKSKSSKESRLPFWNISINYWNCNHLLPIRLFGIPESLGGIFFREMIPDLVLIYEGKKMTGFPPNKIYPVAVTYTEHWVYGKGSGPVK